MKKEWTCERCGKAIANDGHVVLTDAKLGGYPRPYEDINENDADDTGLISYADIPLALENLAVRVIHRKCDPRPNEDAYNIPVARARTLEEWCHWVHHLVPKTWANVLDVQHLLDLWFTNRGDSIHAYNT